MYRDLCINFDKDSLYHTYLYKFMYICIKAKTVTLTEYEFTKALTDISTIESVNRFFMNIISCGRLRDC